MLLTAIVRQHNRRGWTVCRFPCFFERSSAKLYRIMKLTIILLIAFSLATYGRGYSQITLTEKNVPLERIFKKIEKQVDYNFVYRVEWLAKAKKINIQVANRSLEDVLRICFDEQPLSYTIIGNTIVVKQKLPNIQLPPTPPPADVRGRVVDENGDPVIATVTVKGTNKSVSTDKNGEFQIQEVDDNGTLVFTAVNIEAYEIKLRGRSDVGLVHVKTKITALSETVIVGYGSVKRKDLTGSVSSVNVNE